MPFLRDPHFGQLYLKVPGSVSLPNTPIKRFDLREVGIFWAKQLRPVMLASGLLAFEPIWSSLTHNERVDVGAAIQFNRVFGTSGTTANGVITAVAVANANFTKTKTDLSIGTSSANSTTNEFTTIGLSRAAGSLGTYTAPSSLGGTASQVVSKSFSVSGTGTAHGAALFDQVTVNGSNLYVEDLFSSSASLLNGDTLAVSVTITN